VGEVSASPIFLQINYYCQECRADDLRAGQRTGHAGLAGLADGCFSFFNVLVDLALLVHLVYLVLV